MTNYILIESRDPFESRDVQFISDLAASLKAHGDEVTVFFVQNAVLATRRSVPEQYLAPLVQAGVKILADDFSLCERGIQPTEVHPSVRTSNIDELVTALVQENTKAMWH